MTRKKAIRILMYVMSGLLITMGIIIIARELILIPDQEYVAPEGFEQYLGKDVLDVTPGGAMPTPSNIIDGNPKPVKFYFIEREVSCDIIAVGLNSEGQMKTVDDAHDCTWLSKSPWPIPGEPGNAIISGHVTYGGEIGTFSLIKKMSVGEIVAVGFEKGYVRYFKVTNIDEKAYDDTSIMSPDTADGSSKLTLITCLGDYDHSIGTSKHRVVATCVPIS